MKSASAFKTVFQFLVGAGIVAGIGWGIFLVWPRPALPEGWQLIRPPQDVMALVEYEGAILAGGRDGVVRIDREGGQVLDEIQGDVRMAYVTAILVDRVDGSLWVGHALGLSHYAADKWRTLDTQNGLPDNRVLALAQGEAGDLWVGTENGLLHMAAAQKTYTTADGLASPVVSTLFIDSHGRLWAGNGYTEPGGLSMLDDAGWHTFTTADGLAHDMVNTIMEYPQDVLWFGTGFSSYGGLSRLENGTWTTITRDDGLAGWKVRLLFLDEHHTIWVGSEYNGIAYLAGGQWRILTPEYGLAGLEVKAMLQDSHQDLWLGTENGLTRLSQAAWTNLVLP